MAPVCLLGKKQNISSTSFSRHAIFFFFLLELNTVLLGNCFCRAISLFGNELILIKQTPDERLSFFYFRN